jgi:hypothetical protein
METVNPPQPLEDRIAAAVREADFPFYVVYSWNGGRVPQRLTIYSPEDTEQTTPLVDLSVGHMRDNVMYESSTTGLRKIGHISG